MQDLNKFIKAHLKTKKIRVEDFFKLCDISRSMLYRIFNGEQKPSNELIDTMAKVLNLNDVEKLNLIYYCSLIDTDENLSSARNAVYDFLFSEPDTEYEKIEFVYYKDDNKYIKTFDEVLTELLVDSDSEDFSCCVKILNCFDNGILGSIFDIFSKMLTDNKSFNIEHLVRFSKSTYEDNIILLRDIIQLTILGKYSVLYNEGDCINNDNIFENLIILDYKYSINGTTVNKKIIMSFLNDNLSACYVIDSMNLYDFFDRNYNSLKKHFKNAFSSVHTLTMLESTLIELEYNYDLCMFKKDICYNRIPIEAIDHIIKRVPTEDKRHFFELHMGKEIGIDNLTFYEDYFRSYIQKRIDSSYKHKQIDIFTKSGLEEFARTGIMSDGEETFPPLDRLERKMILEIIKKRNSDKNDKYRAYIIDKKYINEEYHILCCQGYGLVVEYINPLLNNAVYHIIIENKKLAEVFTDFAKNYVPNLLSIQEHQINEFIDNLILKYCSEPGIISSE